ncbi:MAG TPA: isopentenyl-diphosphate Delta-isomerase [archaeon]|nr:isopentenyl-diphosphate Delta-isomerase [archaeon]
MKEMIILVDENDKQIGIMEKIEAHSNGAHLHRAFSIFVFDSAGKMLLQKRAKTKYHCPGIWTNACCSHPNDGETLEKAVHRKLKQEFGFDCPLHKAFNFTYKAPFDNGMTEWEFDHVFIGTYDGKINANPDEIDEWKYVDIDELKKDVKKNPEKYTPWFKISLDRVLEHRKKH